MMYEECVISNPAANGVCCFLALQKNLWVDSDNGSAQQLRIDAPHSTAEFGFIIGWLTHLCGDTFGHSWVNDHACGAWSYTEGTVSGGMNKMNLAIPAKFLDAYFSARLPNLSQTNLVGDTTNSAGFVRYFSNIDQFRGGAMYNFFNNSSSFSVGEVTMRNDSAAK